MKITIQEYEEDPIITTTRNLEEENHKKDKEKDTTTASLVRSEFTISVVIDENNDDKQSNNRSNKSLPRVVQIKKQSSLTTTDSTKTTIVTIIRNLWQSICRIFIRLFLPIGYPHSVDDTYLKYQLYDGLQGLCSYWRGVVSTKAVLEATGVGNADASAYSAALNWALRDGTGMIGGLLFSYFVSEKFDIFVKEFRLFADVINDVALMLDMIAPFVPPAQTLWILSASTLCKTMCGMSAGATKGRITHHFARKNGNMADLTAKESTQETLVSLVGMMGGVYVAKLLENSQSIVITWLIFGLLTYIHVWANYEGVLQLKLATLNPERTKIVFHDIIHAISTSTTTLSSSPDDDDTSSKTTTTTTTRMLESAVKELPTPEQIHESLFSSTCHLFVPTLHVGDGGATQSPAISSSDIQKFQYISEFQNQYYVLGIDSNHHQQQRQRGQRQRRNHIYVWLRVGATLKDELQAYLHALIIQECLSMAATSSSSSSGDNTKTQTSCYKWNQQLINRTMKDVQQLFDRKSPFMGGRTLVQILEEKGWDIMENRLYLGFPQTRIQWTIKDE